MARHWCEIGSLRRRIEVSGGKMSVMVTNRGDALVIDIVVVPRASRVGVGSVVGDRLRVAVTAPPVDGAANAAVIEALAEAFGVRRSAVTIVRGQTGRRKTVSIAGGSEATLVALTGAK